MPSAGQGSVQKAAIVVEERREVKASESAAHRRAARDRRVQSMALTGAEPGGGRKDIVTVSGMVVDLVEIGESGREVNSPCRSKDPHGFFPRASNGAGENGAGAKPGRVPETAQRESHHDALS